MRIRALFNKTLGILFCILLLSCHGILNAQSFIYKTTEASEIIHANDLETHGLPDSMTVWCNDWDFITTNPTTWGNTFKLKSNNTFVKFAVNHYFPYTSHVGVLHSSIGYQLYMVYDLYGYHDPTDTVASYVLHSDDTLAITYDNGAIAYQDQAMRKYGRYYKIVVVVKDILSYNGTSYTSTPPSSSPLWNVCYKNYFIEGSIVSQRYDKGYYGISGSPLVTMAYPNAASNYLALFWNYTPGDTGVVPITPISYELEWTYIDDYERDVSSGSTSTISSSSLVYDFTNNATRVWLDTNYYRIPLVYNSGYVVYRVRAVRPDSINHKYPIYGPWSLANSTNYVSALSSDFYQVTTPYKGDSLNWQYTVSFAENGKYKHAMSFYDGLLKNRQSITRLNSNPHKLLVTQNIYDYEGRPAIKTLPASLNSADFAYKHDVALNAVTNLPFEANNFDTGFAVCPYQPIIAPLAPASLASIYYSNQNPDTTGFQKYVPDAEGYPFLHTIYKPGYDDRVFFQGGAGPAMQPGDSNCFQFFYQSPNQAELNLMFGEHIGWKDYYTSTVSVDPNQQRSLSVKDYKGRQVMTAMIGPGPNPTTHAITSAAPPSFTLRDDLLYGKAQTIVGYTKTADFDFFNQANGFDSLQYIFTYNPFPLCPGQALGVKAHYHYDVIDQCGDVVASQDSVLGSNGLITSPMTFSGAISVFSAGMADYHIHKELTVDPVDVEEALDSFFAAPPSCVLSEPYFIRKSVEARSFPCPSDNMDPCTTKKFQMMEELFPGAKYGTYFDTLGNIDGNNSIFTFFPTTDLHRYQDTCTIPSLVDTIIVDGIHYTNLRTMPTDSFIYVYRRAILEGNYSIAEQLLPLHPEYCQLKDCFVDTFQTQVLSIPDHKIAERLNRLYLDSIVAHDPFVGIMNTAFSIINADDSLRTFRGGLQRLDNYALLRAYCSCGDSVMAEQCATGPFLSYVATSTLINDRVKKTYFDEIQELYFANRERFINMVFMSAGDSCSHCALVRMDLTPASIFDHTITAIGTVALDSFATFTSFDGGSSMFWLGTIGTLPSTMDSTMLALYDSAMVLYNYNDSALCYGQIDTVMARLINCYGGLSPSVETAIRNTFDSLCAAHAMPLGDYTPQILRFVLARHSLSPDDLCNPYLVSYLHVPPPDIPSQNCKPDTFYNAASIFMDDTVVTVAYNAPGTIVSDTLNNLSNVFEKRIYDVLGSNTFVQMFAGYDASDKLLTLYVYNDPGVPGVSLTDTVKILLRSPVFGNVFALTADSFNTEIVCLNSIPPLEASGFINEFGFIANITAYGSLTAINYNLLGWTYEIVSMNTAGNPLAGCIPCTQMRDLYTKFRDTLFRYKVYGSDHPYYEQMLMNFMNDELNQSLTADQYTRFIESCAFADSVTMPLYVGYATLTFNSGTDMDDFMLALSSVDTNYSFATHIYADSATSGLITVSVDLNHLPYGELWRYKSFLNAYSTYVDKIVDSPLSALLPAAALGILYTPDIYPFSPIDSVITPLTDTVTYTGYSKKVWEFGSFVPATFYDVTSTSTAPAWRVSRNVYDIRTYLYDHGIPYVRFIPHFESCVNEDYLKPEKKDYLAYTYSFQQNPPYEVLDSVIAPRLLANIPAYSGYQADYTSLFSAMPASRVNLFMSGPGMVNRFFDTLRYILQTVADTNVLNPGYTFFDSSRLVIGSNPTEPLIAYRCSDNTYWYRYFGGGDTLYNVYVAFPAYIPWYQRHLYQILSVNPALGDTSSRYFTLALQIPGDTVVVTAAGLTSFVTVSSIMLRNVLLGDPMLSTTGAVPADTFSNCERYRLTSAVEEGKHLYAEYIDSMITSLTANFTQYLMDSVQEQLILSYINNAFAYTLYHYDLADNLVMTIPPMGVDPLPLHLLSTVDTARRINTPGLVPHYTKGNLFFYNSLNQVTAQRILDAGTTAFYYDPVGRLILSQNDKQSPGGYYTYNIYDKQGRVVETGQARLVTPSFPSYAYDTMAAHIRNFDRQNVILTIYDTAAISLFDSAHIEPQENLRKRIAVVKYFDTLYANDTLLAHFTHASHYSYDISGNLKTLTHDYPALQRMARRYIRIDYDYDLISGKVNMLSYNRGHSDQYYQKYAYDAHNRISAVHTSRNGYIWDNDASYFYYDHGPLARTELGSLHVQGTDYAYTIQGWLKAVNGDTLGVELDMGHDGDTTTGNNAVFSSDIMGHTIDYFINDYKPIASWAGQHVPTQVLNLYNGNITRQTLALDMRINQLHRDYLYDQMNRIKEAHYHDAIALSSTMTPLAAYGSSYSYDLDGNILELVRSGDEEAHPGMDALSYSYGASGTHYTNKLEDVNDCAADHYANDLRNYCPATSSAPRYAYDQLGNTTADLVSGQDTIIWNLYNKVGLTANNADTNKMSFQYNASGNRISKSFYHNLPSGNKEKITNYYVHDAQGNLLTQYADKEEFVPTSDTLLYKTFSLTNQDLYGSSRLGDLRYIGNQLSAHWNYVNNTKDTTKLTNKHLWYSLEYQDGIHPDSLEAYGNDYKDTVYLQHMMGQRRYELTDHLGNVLAVIGDVRSLRTYDTILGYPPGSNNPVIVTGYKPHKLALYDYYPFGMMMEQRTYDDSAAPACVYTELDEPIHWWLYENSKDVGGSCYPCGFDTLGTTHLSPTAMAISAIDTYRLTIAPTPIPDYLLYGNWMTTYRLSGLKPGIAHRIRLEVSGINKPDSSRFPVRVYNQTFSSEFTLLDTFFLPNVAPATFTMTFTPTTPSDTTAYMAIGWQRIFDTVNMPYHYSFSIDSIELHYDTTVILPVMARVCIGDNYRYGHNGQMKTDEITGRGNHYTAQYWEMDSRVGRRWNQDPKPQTGISYYALYNNNPVWYNDILGDTPQTVPVLIPEERWPNVYHTMMLGLNKGKPTVLTYDPSRKNAINRRKDALNGRTPIPNYHWDEYPYASTEEGGKGAAVNSVPDYENTSHGGYLGSLVKTFKMQKGDKFLVIPVPKNNTPSNQPYNVPFPIISPSPITPQTAPGGKFRPGLTPILPNNIVPSIPILIVPTWIDIFIDSKIQTPSPES